MSKYLYATLSIRTPQGVEAGKIELVFKDGEDVAGELAKTVLEKIRPGYTNCSVLVKVENDYGTKVSIWRDDIEAFVQI